MLQNRPVIRVIPRSMPAGERPRGNISLSGAMQASDLFKEQKRRIPGSSLIGKTPVS